MHESLYEQLAQVEDRLWWHEARRQLLRSTLLECSFPVDAVALDIGCGTGGTLGLLREFVPKVIGIDRSASALAWARRKNPDSEFHELDANDLDASFPRSSFDLVTLLNVLEHTWIPNEARVLTQVWRILKPGGTVLVTSAAFSGLARRHDRMAMSRRRHTLPRMRALLELAGFSSIRGTYFNLTSTPLAWLSARWDACRKDEQSNGPLRELSVPPRMINGGMKLLMAAERTIGRLLGQLPFGVSLLCMGQKLLATPLTWNQSEPYRWPGAAVTKLREEVCV